MKVAIEIGMADLYLECAVADRVGVTEELDKVVVIQMEVEPGSICANTVAAASQEAMQWKIKLLGGQVPHCNLDRFFERKAVETLIAAARTTDTMNKTNWR